MAYYGQIGTWPSQPYTYTPQIQTHQNGPTKVSGPQSALQIGYSMGPNRMSEAIFDLNGKVFYIVSTDGAGVPTLETFDFSQHVEQTYTTTVPNYVQRDEFDKAISQLREAIDGIHGSIHPAATATDADIEQPAQ